MDAQLERAGDLIYEVWPLSLFLSELAQANTTSIMILDACRDNPFAKKLARSVGSSRKIQVGAGLGANDDTPGDTLVAMATRANNVAMDGSGKHSPYTEALLAELQVPGLELGLFFRRVRDRVIEVTGGSRSRSRSARSAPSRSSSTRVRRTGSRR